MSRGETRTAIQDAADRLRGLVLDAAPGAFIGSEEALIARLACSRSTVRQVARLLEREGLLKVKRGINGGYFGSRPDANTIETAVSAYLDTLDMDTRDVTTIASALWVEAMRKAAGADAASREAAVERLRRRLRAIKDDASFAQVRDVELLTQHEVFELARSAYIKLIFDINVAFARRRLASPGTDADPAREPAFVRAWREAKLLELGAIAEGNRELAVLASQYSRRIWHRRVWAGAFERAGDAPHAA